MLKIAASHLRDVASAGDAASLHDLVQAAIRLEFSTIPPYLTAMLSLPPGRNREVWDTIHAVVVDEMLHMTIGCNLLNALGGRPVIDDPGFPPPYPGPLPMSIGGSLEVGLEPFSLDLVRRVFMEIEEPENPIPIRTFDAAAALPSFATIGQFYEALIDRVTALGDAAFTGDPARQVVSSKWFPGERLFPIANAGDAARALALIVEEGEGTRLSPVDPDGDMAHYYRFDEVARLRRIARDASAPSGWSFSGPDIPFDPQAVHPLTPNQRLADLDPESQAGRRAGQFASTFTRLLKALHRTFDGDPGHLDAAMGVMFELKLAGQTLAALPAVKDGRPTGLNAGPVFEYVTENF
jgi:hypothetical protein